MYCAQGSEVVLAQKTSRLFWWVLILFALLHAVLLCPFASLLMPCWFFLVVGGDLPFSFS